MVIDLTSVPYLDQSAAKAFIDWMSSVHDQCFPSIVAPEGKYSCTYLVDNHQILTYLTPARLKYGNGIRKIELQGMSEI